MASWKRSLCDGEAHDCLRAYFTPCCVFGQTRYRLERIDSNDNPLDLDGYKTSNAACWDWFFFALPLGIVSIPAIPSMVSLYIDRNVRLG